jgi:hypothetical protein
MLIELLSMSNYGNYNIKVAHILGLEAAIYLNELLNIKDSNVDLVTPAIISLLNAS